MRSAVRRRIFICFFALLIAALVATTGILFNSRRRAQSEYPLGVLPPVSLWYWHTPFALSPSETKTLQDMKVRELFVRAATMTYSGDPNDPVRAALRQQWQSLPPGARAVRIHLVFPVDATLIRRFEKFPEETFALSLAQAIHAEQARAVAAQPELVFSGVQLDLDCPTRLLPRYATVLNRMRPHLRESDALSITLLTSWYDSRAISGLLDQVDFSVPQFYEAQTSPTRSQLHPISDPARLLRGLHQAERLGKPFYVGLPVYGHALVYDGKGRLRGLFHDASASDLMSRPQEFRFLGTAPLDKQGHDAQTRDDFIGEERVEFGPARNGTSAFRLTYDQPTPELLRRALTILRGERLPLTCRGIILYRFPDHREEAVLPLVTASSLFRGNAARPNVRVTLRTRQTAPFDLVEAPPGSPSPPSQRTDLYVTVVNEGTGPVRVAPDAVEVDLFFQHTVLESVRLGGFARMESFRETFNNRASVSRANRLRFFAARLFPGERRVIGPITLLATGGPDVPAVKAQWRVTLPGGFDAVPGALPPAPLSRFAPKVE